jgi:hypothetical protein
MTVLFGGRMSSAETPLKDSKGRGGVMGVPPIGLIARDPSRLGCDVAALTHGHLWFGDGSVRLRFAVTHRPAFRAWVPGLLDHAEVVGPPSLRAEIVEWSAAMAGSER